MPLQVLVRKWMEHSTEGQHAGSGGFLQRCLLNRTGGCGIALLHALDYIPRLDELWADVARCTPRWLPCQHRHRPQPGGPSLHTVPYRKPNSTGLPVTGQGQPTGHRLCRESMINNTGTKGAAQLHPRQPKWSATDVSGMLYINIYIHIHNWSQGCSAAALTATLRRSNKKIYEQRMYSHHTIPEVFHPFWDVWDGEWRMVLQTQPCWSVRLVICSYHYEKFVSWVGTCQRSLMYVQCGVMWWGGF